MTRGNHNIRSGLDMRWTNVYNENYNNSGGNISFTRAFTRSTLNSTSVLEGNAFASFLLGAPSGGNVDVNPMPHYEWFFVAPWIQDDWRVKNKLTLNLGFRWDFNSPVKEADDRLNYVFDPAIAIRFRRKVGQPVMGGLTFAGINGAPNKPWKYDKNNYQFRVGTAYSDQRQDRVARGMGQVLPQPDRSGVQQRVQPEYDADRVERRQPHADLRAGEPVPDRDPGAARQLAGPAHPPRARSELREP